MDINFKNKTYKLEPWVIIFRRLKRYCTNPNSRQYRDYGGRGAKFDFSSALEIKFLWDRDNPSGMENPWFVTKKFSKKYNIKTCQFIEWLDHLDEWAQRIREKQAKQEAREKARLQRKLEKKNKSQNLKIKESRNVQSVI